MFCALAVLLFHSPVIPQVLTTPAGQTIAAVSTVKPSPRPVFETASAAIPKPSWKKPFASAHFEPGQLAAPPDAADAGSEPFAPGASSSSSSMPLAAPDPAARALPYYAAERRRTPKVWYALVAASLGAATFDAWTTRRVISS